MTELIYRTPSYPDATREAKVKATTVRDEMTPAVDSDMLTLTMIELFSDMLTLTMIELFSDMLTLTTVEPVSDVSVMKRMKGVLYSRELVEKT